MRFFRRSRKIPANEPKCPICGLRAHKDDWALLTGVCLGYAGFSLALGREMADRPKELTRGYMIALEMKNEEYNKTRPPSFWDFLDGRTKKLITL